MAAQLVQMVTVVDKSGKAVKSVCSPPRNSSWKSANKLYYQSKHIVDVWKEAKAAYKERKAEVVANRYGSPQGSPSTTGPSSRVDDRSQASSRAPSKSHRRRRHRSHEDHHRAQGSPTASPTSPNIYMPAQSPTFEDVRRSAPTTPSIQRSFTDKDQGLQLTRAPPPPVRSYTTPSSPTIDMDLAYGDLPGAMPLTTRGDEEEMKGLVSTVKRLLEEADCLHHSATKTIAMLQKNPEAMAAVALTLAEISNIAKTMAPGAVASMSKGAPAVFGLLASPQFLIAGGVAVGLTVVAFGGYKVIKQIKAKQEGAGMDEMIEVNTDVSRIETWRRGIAEEQASSVGTSVDGEYITPTAAALSRLNLEETRKSSSRHGKEKRRHRTSKTVSEDTSRPSSKATSWADSSAASSNDGTLNGSSKGKTERKAKKPSPLRLMFK